MLDHDLMREIGELVLLIILAVLRNGRVLSSTGRKSSNRSKL